MTDINSVTIGGEAIPLPPILNFAALKRAWPGIKAFGAATDTVERVSAAIAVVSATLARQYPELTPAEIEERLRPGEIMGLVEALPAILDASGLVPSGEATPAEPGSTATSTQ
jgi:hypothetical protein